MGNMTSRDEAGLSWIQPFNADGRMERVTDQGTSDEWGFIYSGDGARVGQSNPDGTTTLFIAGGSYEVVIDAQGEEVSIRKYYALGGQRVMREDNSNYFLLTDHLGSIVGIVDGSGSLISEQRYMPYGLPRLEPGIDETDFGFTGQRMLIETGLIDYNTRWYDPGISRWSQADPLPIDLPGRQQIVERYSYVSGSPIMYADPTGLRTCDLVSPGGKCYTHNADETLAEYGIHTTGISDDDAKWRIADAAVAIASKLSDATHGHGVDAFKFAMGDVTIEIGMFPGKGNCSTTGRNITP